MLLSQLQRLPWQLMCLLFATVATATISPSNSSTAIGQFQGTLPLQEGVGSMANVADLVPITKAAATQTVRLVCLCASRSLIPKLIVRVRDRSRVIFATSTSPTLRT